MIFIIFIEMLNFVTDYFNGFYLKIKLNFEKLS